MTTPLIVCREAEIPPICEDICLTFIRDQENALSHVLNLLPQALHLLPITRQHTLVINEVNNVETLISKLEIVSVVLLGQNAIQLTMNLGGGIQQLTMRKTITAECINAKYFSHRPEENFTCELALNPKGPYGKEFSEVRGELTSFLQGSSSDSCYHNENYVPHSKYLEWTHALLWTELEE